MSTASLHELISLAHIVKVNDCEVDEFGFTGPQQPCFVVLNCGEDLTCMVEDLEVQLDEQGDCFVHDSEGDPICISLRMSRPMTLDDLKST